MEPSTPPSADAALRQLRGAVAHCLDEADHLPEGELLSQRWSIDAFDALRRFEALDDLITRQGHLPADWHPHHEPDADPTSATEPTDPTEESTP
jgi:hypothetical protein